VLSIGGYTVLATKGVSSMLSSTLFRAFTTPVTYALLLVLLGTAIMQVRYVNKALQRFDSTQVIPIQFVLFTLSVIIGSAVLYRDFERTSAEQAMKFVGGCLLTFFSVFLITSGRGKTEEEEEDELSDEQGVEETIGLAEQGPHPRTPQPGSRRGSEAARSRRSSRASRVSFIEAVNKPLTVLADSGVPSLRVPTASTSRTALVGDGAVESPMLEADNPWRDPNSLPSTPGGPSQAVSSESVPTIGSIPHILGQPVPQVPSASDTTLPLFVESPATPRAQASLSSSRPHSHHFATPIYSPSPLSSTVSAVVADTLLRNEGPTSRRLSVRRSRLGLRNSLFVPQDELGDDLLDIENGATIRDRSSRDHTALAVPEEEGLLGGDGRRSLRTRARSLSHAIGDMFSKKKRRRGASAAGDGDETSAHKQDETHSSVVGQSSAAQRSTRSLETT
jgi:magnesium transporter